MCPSCTAHTCADMEAVVGIVSIAVLFSGRLLNRFAAGLLLQLPVNRDILLIRRHHLSIILQGCIKCGHVLAWPEFGGCAIGLHCARACWFAKAWLRFAQARPGGMVHQKSVFSALLWHRHVAAWCTAGMQSVRAALLSQGAAKLVGTGPLIEANTGAHLLHS